MGFRDIYQSLDGQWNIRLEVHSIFIVITSEHEFVELLIFFFSDFFSVSGPDGFDEIDSFSVNGNGEVNKVRILVDDVLDVRDISEVRMIFSQMESDSGTSL